MNTAKAKARKDVRDRVARLGMSPADEAAVGRLIDKATRKELEMLSFVLGQEYVRGSQSARWPEGKR